MTIFQFLTEALNFYYFFQMTCAGDEKKVVEEVEIQFIFF